MNQILAFCLALLCCVLPARAGDDGGFISLQTPSGNIHCQVSSEARSIDCEILVITTRNPAPERLADCDLEWGNRFYLEAKGTAELLCTGDTLRSEAATVLPYGETWTFGLLSCASAETGLTCRNGEGHGFILSKMRQTVF